MSNRVKWIITLLVPLLVYCIPTTDAFTLKTKLFFICTLFPILIAAFDLLPMVIYSLAFPFLYIFVVGVPPDIAFKPLTMHVPYIIIGGMMLSLALEETKLLNRISYGILSVTGKSFAGLIFGIMLIGYVLCFLIPDIGTRTIILATFVYGMCKSLDLKPGSRAGAALMITASYAALNSAHNYYLNQAYFPWGASGLEIEFMDFIKLFMVPQTIFFFLSTFIVLLFFKPEKKLETRDFFIDKLKSLGKITWQEVFAMVIIIITLYMCANNTGAIGWIFCISASVFYLPIVGIGKAEKLTKVNYPLFLFLAGCMAIGMAGGFSGGGKFIADSVTPLLTGAKEYTIGMLWLFGVLVNFVLTPLAGQATLSMPAAQIASNVGLDPNIGVFAFVQGLEQVLLPYEYVLVLIVFSYGYINMKDFVKGYGGKMLLSIVSIMTVGIGYWKLIGAF
ncbi:SLC13 family permease [Desulfosediminicola flagellatus]|uniref:SLC13 family permease n=1 Tax=Desulfosediminicola flagellatus TaxID=2569541 RepID=UPI0010AD6F84|nr:SLC13 family permease [Desulfosediminicola flagellatus]